MKVVTTIIFISLVLFLVCEGCSKEEPPPPPPKKIQKIKIAKAPERPEHEEGIAPIPGEREMAQARQPEKATAPLVEEKQVKMPEIVAQEKEAAGVEMKGYYIVKKGESLYDVAEREDVYMDPMKWPLLLRVNMDALGHLQTQGDVTDKELPEGLRLKITPQDEVKENLKKRSGDRWVINVLSTTTNRKIIPLTIKLVKNGYSAYLTHATIRGKDWIRLRVGFFNNKAEADAEKEKIRSILHLGDLWSVKLGPKEFEEFAGY
jgi:hypothetical protein